MNKPRKALYLADLKYYEPGEILKQSLDLICDCQKNILVHVIDRKEDLYIWECNSCWNSVTTHDAWDDYITYIADDMMRLTQLYP